MAARRPIVQQAGVLTELADSDALVLPSAAVAPGSTTPNPGQPSVIWSTLANAPLQWDGTVWRPFVTLGVAMTVNQRLI